MVRKESYLVSVAMVTCLAAGLLLVFWGRPLLARFDAAGPAATTGAIAVNVPSALAVEEIFPVTIEAAQVSDAISAFQLTLSYDPDILAFHGAVDGTFLARTDRTVICPPVRPTPGTVRLACASTGAGVGALGSGELVVLTFSALAPGQSDLTLSAVQLVDDNSPPTLADVTLQNGQVTVRPEGDSAVETELFLPSVQRSGEGRSRQTGEKDDQLFLPAVGGDE